MREVRREETAWRRRAVRLLLPEMCRGAYREAEGMSDLMICMECGQHFPHDMAAWRLDERVWVPWCPVCIIGRPKG